MRNKTAIGLSVIVLLIALVACNSPTSSPAVTTPTPSPTPTLSLEVSYLASVDAALDTFSNHRDEYNSGVERLGAMARAAITDAEYESVLRELIAHLDNTLKWYSQDLEDFISIIPPPKYLEFHLLMSSVIRDTVDANTILRTYYSEYVNRGVELSELATQASSLIRNSNENYQRAKYMYTDLLGE